MSGRVGRTLERLREPAYTGENRCVPCTVVNAAIAVVAGLLVALASPVLGAVVLVVSAILIALRGYLVPGTPALTQRYLPARVRALFDHADDGPVRTATDEETDPTEFETLQRIAYERQHAVDPETYLADAGAIDPDADGRELTPAFADAVAARAARLGEAGVGPDDVAALFGTAAEDVSRADREYPAFRVERRIRKWPSRGALVADLATHGTLAEWRDDWADVPREQRVEVLETLRTYLDACPECGGSLDYHDETFESCCGRYEVAIYGCVDCGERLLEFDPALVDREPGATGIVPDLEEF